MGGQGEGRRRRNFFVAPIRKIIYNPFLGLNSRKILFVFHQVPKNNIVGWKIILQKYSIQDSIETKGQDILLWQMKLTEIQEELTTLLTNNKFAVFLNRIFKKKKAIKHSEDSGKFDLFGISSSSERLISLSHSF